MFFEMTWIKFLLLFIYGLPLFPLRKRFRTAVYKDGHWTISFRPWFIKETIALFSNRYFTKREEKTIGRNYRLYVCGYILLLLLPL